MRRSGLAARGGTHGPNVPSPPPTAQPFGPLRLLSNSRSSGLKRVVQITGEKFRCVTRPSSGRRWRKAPVAVSRTSPAPRPVITKQLESGLNLASQVEMPFVQIRGSSDLIRTSQSRAVPSAEAVARRWPLPGKLRNQILPECSLLRVSNSPVARFTQPRLPSRSPTNMRSPDGEKARAEIPLRGQTVSEGLEGRNKPPVSDLRFQTESSFTPADAAQRSSTSRSDLGS